MKPPKHFVVHTALKDNGQIAKQVVLTPPLDSEEEAQAYADWYNRAKNPVCRFIAAGLDFGHAPNDEPLGHIARVIETSLY